MITKLKVKTDLNLAVKELEECWILLTRFKKRDFDSSNFSEVLDFQPKLANILFNLSNLHKCIAWEKKALTKKRSDLSQKWFQSRIDLFKKYQDSITRIIFIGKTLGDAFAWFFYQQDRHYLSKHLSQEEIVHNPTGIGGAGELEFVKNIPVVHGCIVLFHGITSILRLGDFTLIDKNTLKVAGVGELKTNKKDKEHIQVNLFYSGPGINKKNIESKLSLMKDKIKESDQEHEEPKFTNEAKIRFEKQLDRITESFKDLQREVADKIHLESTDNFSVLDSLIQDSKCSIFKYKKIGNGLLLASIKERKNSLVNNLLSTNTFEFANKLDGIEDKINKITNNKYDDNSLRVGSFFYNNKGKSSHIAGMTHLFWWPLNLESLKKIIFQDVTIVTLYNPAYLCNHLRSNGFTVQENKGKELEISKKISKSHYIKIGGVFYFMQMIQNYLMREEDINKILNEAVLNIKSKNIKGTAEIKLEINQIM